MRVYLATGLTDVGRPDAHDEEADLTLRWFPLDEAVRMVLSGEIVNSIAVARDSGRPHRRPTPRHCGPSTRRGPTGRQRSPAGRGTDDHLSGPPSDDQLQGYLDHLTIERGVAANTLSSYRRDLRRYAEHLTARGIDDLAKVTETDVSDFLVSLRRGDPDTEPRRCRRCRRPAR